MYRWYSEAEVCYVYLADISVRASMQDKKAKKLKNSRWFTRGWTLQELLAPLSMIFYDWDWIEIGTKSSLKSSLSDAAHISAEHILNPKSASVAAKMSWAASRSTTRTEDIAYCLLGLFDVNMPLLYGEGSKAFQRLQQAILGSSADESIFAWVMVPEILRYFNFYEDHLGILATHPGFFLKSGNIVRKRLGFKELGSFHITNGRLEMTLRARKYQDPDSDCKNCESWEIPLACAEASQENEPLRLLLHRRGETVLACKKCNPDLDYFDVVSTATSEFNSLTTVRFQVVLDTPYDLGHPLLWRYGLPHFDRLRVDFTQSVREAFPIASLLNNLTWTETPKSSDLEEISMTLLDMTGTAFTIKKIAKFMPYDHSHSHDSVEAFQEISIMYSPSGANTDRYTKPLVTFRRPPGFFSKKIGHSQYLTFATMLNSRTLNRQETNRAGNYYMQKYLRLEVDVSEFDVSDVL